MSSRWDVLGIGNVAVDDLIYVEEYPSPGSETPMQRCCRQGGGLIATALVAASRLGVRTAYFSVLGGDTLSCFTIEELELEGVDCSLVLIQPGARPTLSTIIVDSSTGRRTILLSRDRVSYPGEDDVADDMVAGCRVLLVDHLAVEAALRATAIARAHHIPVVADIERIPSPDVLDLITQVDHLIISLELGARLTSEHSPEAIVASLSHSQRACCAVTAGDRGCWYSEHGCDVRHFPAFTVRPIDTTGCGDVFHGAYAATLAQGENVSTAIRMASATAAIKATQPGGRRGIPDRIQLGQFLSERGAHQ